MSVKKVGEIDYAVKDGDDIIIQCGDGSKPVGVVHLSKKSGCVFGLILLEEVQNNGLAQILLTKLEEEAKKLGSKKVFSEITEINEKSKNLFIKCGYAKNDSLSTSINDYGLKMLIYEKIL